jgi:hypothetical protein
MADNLQVSQGTGTTVATDDIGGVHYQKIESMRKRADDTVVDSWYDSGAISNADVDALETVAEIDCQGFTTCFITFSTTVALTDFTVDFRVHASGSYVNIATDAADYTSLEGPILGASGDLTAASSSGTHWLKLDVTGVQSVRIQAASTSANVTGHYGLN